MQKEKFGTITKIEKVQWAILGEGGKGKNKGKEKNIEEDKYKEEEGY